MGDENPLESRPPNIEDLIDICKALNDSGAKYIVIGGMAIIQQGFTRATEDIDLLVDDQEENIQRVKEALLTLPDRAAEDLEPQDIREYVAVRIGDEVNVDVMGEACGVDYAGAEHEVSVIELRGVPIPFASLPLLWRLKQGVRAKDELDREFLRRKLER